MSEQKNVIYMDREITAESLMAMDLMDKTLRIQNNKYKNAIISYGIPHIDNHDVSIILKDREISLNSHKILINGVDIIQKITELENEVILLKNVPERNNVDNITDNITDTNNTRLQRNTKRKINYSE